MAPQSLEPLGIPEPGRSLGHRKTISASHGGPSALDRWIARSSAQVQAIDLSVMSRDLILGILKHIDYLYSASEQSVRRARMALEREGNEELKSLHRRRIQVIKNCL